MFVANINYSCFLSLNKKQFSINNFNNISIFYMAGNNNLKKDIDWAVVKLT